MNKIFSFQHAISLSDSDVSGLIYFPKFFDLSVRVLEAFLSSRQMNLQKCFQLGIFMPIVSTCGNFYLPVRFGDVINIDLFLKDLGNSSLTLQYEFLNNSGILCAKTSITHVTVNNQMEPISIPKDLQAILCNKV